MKIIHDDFKKANKELANKIKEGFKGLVKPFKPTKEQKLVKLEAKIEKLRKEVK